MSSIRIEKTDITKLAVDCIVNAANSGLKAGGGVCGAIFTAAGYDLLSEACNALGGCPTGGAVITDGFNLEADYIIHTVGPRYKDGKSGEQRLLRSCYERSLELAMSTGIHSIAFPLISSGIYGYPKDEAWETAIQACNDFLAANSSYDLDIIFAVTSDSSAQLGTAALEKIGAVSAAVSPAFLGAYADLEKAISDWHASGRSTPVTALYDLLAKEIKNGMEVLVPMRQIDDNSDDVSFIIQRVSDSNGLWLPVFTNQGELGKGEQTSVCPQLMRDILSMALEDNDCVGVVLNPFGNSLSLSRGICADILDFLRPLTQDELELNAGAKAYQRGDFETAVALYTKSANAGNVNALSNLGYCHYYGRSIPVDKQKAKECWERAAILGDLASVYKLGDMYRNGDLEPDLGFSHALYKRAFFLAQYTEDIYLYPDAYLRMLKYHIDELSDAKAVAERCVAGIKARIAEGDNYSSKVLTDAEAILNRLSEA